MDKQQLPHLTRLATQLALAGLITVSAISLAACSEGKPNIVKCVGVPLNHNGALYIDKGLCKKLAGGKPVPVTCQQWSSVKNDVITCEDEGSQLKAQQYPASQYIKCYGVAAASMNDCGTPKTACGGSVHVAREKDAWIAIPDGLCRQIKGSVIGKMK